MGIGNQILFFLAGLGVFNGFLLALCFFFLIKPQRWVNVLFGLLMLMLCIRIGKSVFHIFTDVDRIYRQIGLSACILLGPLLWLYVRHFLSDTSGPKRSDIPHLLIPLVTIVTVGMIWPYEIHPDAWNYQIVRGIYAVWIVYMIASSWLVVPLARKAFRKEATIRAYWLLLLVSSILLLCIAYNLAYYGFPYLSGPLLFSFVFYVLTGFLISKKNYSNILQAAPIKYQNQKINPAQADQLLQSLSGLMQEDKPYLSQKIKLADIAQSIDATPHEVSQVINDRLGISFNQYINEYRIKEACTLLKESDHLTVEGIGQEVGFSSRSTFYTAFKAVMKQTPGKYKQHASSRPL